MTSAQLYLLTEWKQSAKWRLTICTYITYWSYYYCWCCFIVYEIRISCFTFHILLFLLFGRSVVSSCSLVVVNKYCFVFFTHSMNNKYISTTKLMILRAPASCEIKTNFIRLSTHGHIIHSHALIHSSETHTSWSLVSTNRHALHITNTNALAKWRK